MPVPTAIHPDSPFARLERAAKYLRDAHKRTVTSDGPLEYEENCKAYYARATEFRLALKQIDSNTPLMLPPETDKG